MKSFFRIAFLWLSVTGTVNAQQSGLVSFEQPIAGLGTIVDNQGVVNHQFLFTNISSDSVAVHKVTTSCGCTSTKWTSDLIPPGGSGFIEVQFDPFNRPGAFEKIARVHFKGQSDATELKIKGLVNPASASIAEEFPLKMGSLRTKVKILDLGTITKKILYSKSFEVYNESNKILVFADDMEGPNHITVTFEPYTLKPNSRGKVWVHYDVKAKNDLGFYSEEIGIFTYEQNHSRKDFTITTTLLDIPEVQLASSPKIYFDKTEIDFGIKQQGDTVNVQFPVHNRGQSKLKLKKVFGNCNCIRVGVVKTELNPGQSTNISVRFLTNDRLGNQEKTITLFTDDPQMPVAILTVKGRLRGPRN